MPACPRCHSTSLFGPAVIVDTQGRERRYFDCGCCHTMLLVDLETGELLPRAGAW
jgi:formate dehydrogenase maturation protein FdhE